MNPGFDGDAQFWEGAGAYRATPDADGCSQSGSLALIGTGHQFRQCVPTNTIAPTHFYFAYRYRNWDFNDNVASSGGSYCNISFIADNNGCGYESVTSSTPDESVQSAGGAWVQGGGDGMTPQGTTSVMITCQAVLGTGFYDLIYLGASAPPSPPF
jgi:hypothetical protein